MASESPPHDFLKPADLFRQRRISGHKPTALQPSPIKFLNNVVYPSPTKNLPTLLKNPFKNQASKRRLNLGSPTKSPIKSPIKAKRTRMLEMDDDANMEAPQQPTQHNLESCYKATRGATTLYQHPYFSWQTLFPRYGRKTRDGSANVVPLSRYTDATKLIHSDWNDSLNDLIDLLIEGKCSFFYLCSDLHNILFRNRGQEVCAHISPMNFKFASRLRKSGIKVHSDNDGENNVENEQQGSGDIEEDEDASQFLESIGVTVSQKEFPSIQSRSRSGTADSQKIADQATVIGPNDVRELVKFLQANNSYTISHVGDFALIPPTLLAPCEFKLSTKLRDQRWPDINF